MSAAIDLQAVGDELEAAVQKTLEALEHTGMAARDADEFIRDCVFTAWWDWDYGVLENAAGEPIEQAAARKEK
jgi:hypothetical protein